MDGRFHRFLALLDMGGDVLQHHYGIVHHHTDSYGKCRHRNDIQGVTRSEEVNKGCQQGDRDGKYDNDRGLPASEEKEDHKRNDQEGDDDRLYQSVDGIDDLGRRVVDYADLDIGRESLLNLPELLLHITDDIHRIGSRLLLDGNTGSAHSVGIGFLLPFFTAIPQTGHIPEIYGIAVRCADYNVKQLARIREFLLHPQGVRLGPYVDIARRNVLVLCRYNLSYSTDSQSIGLKPGRVAVNLDLTGRSADHRHCTHSVYTGKRGGKFIVEDFLKPAHTLLCRSREQHNGHIVGAELENHRERSPVRKVGVDHIQLVADIVRGLLYVCSVLECKHQQGDILLGLRGELLEVLYAIERVLKDFCEVILYIPGVGSRVRGHNHNGICIKIRELRYRHLAQGENSQDGESDKYKSGRYRMFDAGAVNAHCATSTLSPTLREAWPLTTTLSPSLRPERISY